MQVPDDFSALVGVNREIPKCEIGPPAIFPGVRGDFPSVENRMSLHVATPHGESLKCHLIPEQITLGKSTPRDCVGRVVGRLLSIRNGLLRIHFTPSCIVFPFPANRDSSWEI